MTRAELVEEIRNTFERAEGLWLEGFDNSRVGSVVFYLSALHKVQREPFNKNHVHREIVAFLQAKLDAVFDKLLEEDRDQVFLEMEKVG